MTNKRKNKYILIFIKIIIIILIEHNLNKKNTFYKLIYYFHFDKFLGISLNLNVYKNIYNMKNI